MIQYLRKNKKKEGLEVAKDKNPPPKNPPPKKPEKPNPAEDPKNCKTCGAPLGSHTILQLADCNASQN